MASFPESTFGNGPTELLANGQVLAGSNQRPQHVSLQSGHQHLVGRSDQTLRRQQRNESWTLLPDGSILSYDVNGNPGEAQRLDPTTMTLGRCGRGARCVGSRHQRVLRHGTRCALARWSGIAIGRSSQTAIYTPPTPGDGTNGVGSWTAGPVIPNGLEAGGERRLRRIDARRSCPTVTCCFAPTCPIPADRRSIFEFDPTAPAGDFADRRHTADCRLPNAIRSTMPRGCCCFPRGRCCWEMPSRTGCTATPANCTFTRRTVRRKLPGNPPSRAWWPAAITYLDRHATERRFGWRQPRHEHADGHQLPDRRIEERSPGRFISPARSTGAAPAWPPAARRRRPISRCRPVCRWAPIR